MNCPIMRSSSPVPWVLPRYSNMIARNCAASCSRDAGAGSHVAIVARALGIAAVGDVANILDFVEPGDAIIVDGLSGDVHVRPTPDVQHAYAEKARLRAKRQEQYRRLRNVAAVTRTGLRSICT